MADNELPPPTYAQATGQPNQSSNAARTQRSERSKEELSGDQLPLPQGWLRQYDQNHKHSFYVDTAADPPRSIWQHPYLTEEYLQTLSPDERDRIQNLVKASEDSFTTSNDSKKVHAKLRNEDSSSGILDGAGPSSLRQEARPSARQDPQQEEKKTFGRKMKDKLTGSTHAEREQHRFQRHQEEERLAAEEAHLRNAVAQAESSGVPQHIGKDKYGHDVYVEPSYSTYPYQAGGYAPRGRVNGYPGSVPYQQRAGYHGDVIGGPYGDPNARFVRVQRGSSFGSGYGLPIAGGLLGGLLLGGLLAAPF